MLYSIYAIKPEHWYEHDNNILSVLDLIKDDWYEDVIGYKHNIWPHWRSGYIECEDYVKYEIPENLLDFYCFIYDSKSALTVADKLERHLDFSGEIVSLIEWLRFWANKKARFCLSDNFFSA